MKASNFLLHRLQVQLNMRGIEYVFSRQTLDKFGQPIEGDDDENVIVGIYHESNSYIQTTGGNATVIRTRKSPMILCLFADGDKIKQGDRIVINEKHIRFLVFWTFKIIILQQIYRLRRCLNNARI